MKNQTDLSIDVRKIAHESITISVQLKNMWLFKIGLYFIRIGCWMTGAKFIEEFPMSLIQPNEATEEKKTRKKK